jgi:hypothetical protein
MKYSGNYGIKGFNTQSISQNFIFNTASRIPFIQFFLRPQLNIFNNKIAGFKYVNYLELFNYAVSKNCDRFWEFIFNLNIVYRLL